MPVTLQQQNLKVSSQYLSFIKSHNRAIVCNLYKFTSFNGAVDYFTDMDCDINFFSVIWKSGSLRISGIQRKTAIGLSVDEQTMKIAASPTDTLFGSNFLTGAEQGLLDGCLVQRYRAIWPVASGNAFQDVQQLPIAVYCLFTGYTAEISNGGVASVEVKVRSALAKLEVNMPQNYYQPGCNWTLFDNGCTLIKQNFVILGNVDNGPSANVLPIVNGLNPVNGLDGLPQYAQGRLQFLSGVNSGLEVLIDTNDANNLYLAYALDQLPSPGDQVIFTPGCSKMFNTCDKKYSNKANFRGFDKVPPVSISL